MIVHNAYMYDCAVKTACTYAVSESCIITRAVKYNITRVRLVYLRQMHSLSEIYSTRS